MGTYLYLYESREEGGGLYIGIGDEMTRAWGPHNEDAEALLARRGAELLQTPEPFSTRADALKAEAIAIHVAALAGVRVVLSDHVDTGELIAQATNRAGMKSTSHLVSAVMRKAGTVKYDDVTRTAVVVLKPGGIDERGSLHGGRDVATFAARAEKHWPLTTAHRLGYCPRRLLAVMKTSRIILGDWDLDQESPVTDEMFVLADPDDDDPRGVKGMWFDWGSTRVGNQVTWSEDIRDEFL